MENGITKAIRLAGSQTALGNLVGLTPQAIQKWAAQGFVPGERCRQIEEALKGEVTRYELNAGVFGDAPPASPKRRRRDDQVTPP